MKTVKKYKGIDLKYGEGDGLIHFEFEGEKRKTKYVFEAEQIIDEPVWQACELEGYFVDGYSDKFIGIARAEKLNIKSGEPYWLYKGQYDHDFKRPSLSGNPKVYPKNEKNNEVYAQWQAQKKVYLQELKRLNAISELLTPSL